MTLPRRSALIGLSLSVSVLLLIGFITQSAAEIPTNAMSGEMPARAQTIVTYHAPRLDGFDLDTRLTRHRQLSPVPTAERYCQERGYLSAHDFMLRPSIATRTLGDNVVHIDRSGRRQTFAMIQCISQPEG